MLRLSPSQQTLLEETHKVHHLRCGHILKYMNLTENSLNVLQAEGRLKLLDQSFSHVLPKQYIVNDIRKLLRGQNAVRRSILPHRLVVLPEVIDCLGHARR